MPAATISEPLKLIATITHTTRLVMAFTLLTVGGLIVQMHSSPPSVAHPSQTLGHIPLYLSLIGSEWLLARAVNKGILRTGMNWRDLLGPRFFHQKGLMQDVVWAVATVAVWLTVTGVLSAGSAKREIVAHSFLLPLGTIERIVWAGVSLSAGICEEFAFRGYFQQQFTAIAGSRLLGILLQAALFGAIHSYQGLTISIAIAAYGLVLGFLVAWRKDLRSAIMAHVLTDLFFGLAPR